jgi:hypothetical protein
VKFLASRAFQPGNIFGILKALYHLLIFLNRQNYRYGFAIARNNFRFSVRRFHASIVAAKVRDGEGAIASTRGGCAPRKEATVPSRLNCGTCYLALLTLTRHLLGGNRLQQGFEFSQSLLK